MRHLIAVAGLAATLSLLALSGIAAGRTTKSIKIGDDYFVHPQRGAVVTVHHGTRVVWRFRGQDSHNVTVSHGPRKFHSHTQSDGTFAKVINTRGTYRIYCTVHGAAVMRMTLKVR